MSVESDMKAKVATSKEVERLKPKNTNSQNITVESLKKHMPKGSSIAVTEEIVEQLNSVERDSGVEQEYFEEQLLGYMHLAKKGGVLKLMNAIKFVTLIQTPGITNEQAYRIVFPDKAKEADSEGRTLDSFASMYNSSYMVKEITKMQVIGFHVSHAHLKNWGMAKLVNLANGIGARPSDKVSPTVQLNAVQTIIEKVAPPEDLNIELRVGMSDDAKSATQDLADKIGAMAEVQMAGMKAGRSIADVQKLNIDFIDATVVEE